MVTIIFNLPWYKLCHFTVKRKGDENKGLDFQLISLKKRLMECMENNMKIVHVDYNVRMV